MKWTKKKKILVLIPTIFISLFIGAILIIGVPPIIPNPILEFPIEESLLYANDGSHLHYANDGSHLHYAIRKVMGGDFCAYRYSSSLAKSIFDNIPMGSGFLDDPICII
ncbi:MAG: hypothetical protein ACQERB_03975 [Promethearchaeati archaeon]